MRTAIAMALIVAAEPAEACHHYSIWKNPWPQRCRVSSHPVRYIAPRALGERGAWFIEITRLPDLPAPDLPVPDELTGDGRDSAIAKAKVLLGKPR